MVFVDVVDQTSLSFLTRTLSLRRIGPLAQQMRQDEFGPGDLCVL